MPTPQSDHDMIKELYTAICGVNGQDGLLREFKTLKTDHYKLKETFWKFFWIATGIAMVTGMSFGGVKLFDLLIKGG
jgi:hypothetical protein